MENASKALIIAGAILLAILIIGLGMVVYSRASGALDTSTIDQQKVQAYNSPYEQYFGDKVSGSQVRGLIDTVRAHNNATISDQSLLIKITSSATGATATGVSSSADLNTLKGKIQSGKVFKVTGTTYNANTGYLELITIANP